MREEHTGSTETMHQVAPDLDALPELPASFPLVDKQHVKRARNDRGDF